MSEFNFDELFDADETTKTISELCSEYKLDRQESCLICEFLTDLYGETYDLGDYVDPEDFETAYENIVSKSLGTFREPKKPVYDEMFNLTESKGVGDINADDLKKALLVLGIKAPDAKFKDVNPWVGVDPKEYIGKKLGEDTSVDKIISDGRRFVKIDENTGIGNLLRFLQGDSALRYASYGIPDDCEVKFISLTRSNRSSEETDAILTLGTYPKQAIRVSLRGLFESQYKKYIDKGFDKQVIKCVRNAVSEDKVLELRKDSNVTFFLKPNSPSTVVSKFKALMNTLNPDNGFKAFCKVLKINAPIDNLLRKGADLANAVSGYRLNLKVNGDKEKMQDKKKVTKESCNNVEDVSRLIGFDNCVAEQVVEFNLNNTDIESLKNLSNLLREEDTKKLKELVGQLLPSTEGSTSTEDSTTTGQPKNDKDEKNKKPNNKAGSKGKAKPASTSTSTKDLKKLKGKYPNIQRTRDIDTVVNKLNSIKQTLGIDTTDKLHKAVDDFEPLM